MLWNHPPKRSGTFGTYRFRYSETSGSGFKRLAEEKSTVKKGDPIMKIDRKLIEWKGYNLVTPVLITNMDAVKDLSCIIGGNVSAGRDVIATYKLK